MRTSSMTRAFECFLSGLVAATQSTVSPLRLYKQVAPPGAVLSGVAFVGMSLGVRRGFGWRLFSLHGADELKRELYPKLMLFWALWKAATAPDRLIQLRDLAITYLTPSEW